MMRITYRWFYEIFVGVLPRICLRIGLGAHPAFSLVICITFLGLTSYPLQAVTLNAPGILEMGAMASLDMYEAVSGTDALNVIEVAENIVEVVNLRNNLAALETLRQQDDNLRRQSEIIARLTPIVAASLPVNQGVVVNTALNALALEILAERLAIGQKIANGQTNSAPIVNLSVPDGESLSALYGLTDGRIGFAAGWGGLNIELGGIANFNDYLGLGVDATGSPFGSPPPGPAESTTKTVSLNGGTLIAEFTLIAASWNLQGIGLIEGNVVNIGGTVSPGLLPDALTIDGEYSQDSTVEPVVEISGAKEDTISNSLNIPGDASLNIEVNTEPDNPILHINISDVEAYSRLVVNGTAELNSLLEVHIDDSSFSPNLQERFTILEAAEIIGNFNRMYATPGLFGGGLTFSLHYNRNPSQTDSVEIEVVSAPDFDDDGDVDAVDLAIFSSRVGSISCLGQTCESNFDNDLDIDGVDIFEFSNRYQFSKGDIN